MKRYGIFYGSTTGSTEDVAHRIAKRLDISDSDIHNVASTAPSAVADYDVLLLGTSTWGSGELQDDWYDFVAGMRELDLKGKQIAIFGVGDESMSDTFCSAVGKLYEELQPTGAEFIGAFPDDVYHFDHTDADVDGVVVGLLLDETNHPDLTDGRIEKWTEQIRRETAE